MKPITYRVADENGELIEGVFYKEELTPVKFSTDEIGERGRIFAVEEILEEKIHKDGKKYFLVKWRGYPESENQWVRADRLVSVGKSA